MKTFQEYYDQRADEGLFGYSKKDYTGWKPKTYQDYKPGLLKNQPVHDPSARAVQAAPGDEYTGWQTRTPMARPGPTTQRVQNDNVVSTWQVVYRNLIDQDPSLGRDQDLKVRVYKKVKELERTRGISDPVRLSRIVGRELGYAA